MSYFCHYYLFNLLYFDMVIKPSFKVQKIALINIKIELERTDKMNKNDK